MDIIIQNLLKSLKAQLHLCMCHLNDELLQSWLALERARWRSKNCLSIFNHSNNHYDCWNRTDLRTAAHYLRPAVAPLWIPLHDKHLSLSEPSAVLGVQESWIQKWQQWTWWTYSPTSMCAVNIFFLLYKTRIYDQTFFTQHSDCECIKHISYSFPACPTLYRFALASQILGRHFTDIGALMIKSRQSTGAIYKSP